MALLQALRSIHTKTNCQVYIDNTGVIDTAAKRRWDDPNARLEQGGRAVWNRIEHLTRMRSEAGATTELQWIHSHVDDEARQKWNPQHRRECACGGGGEQKCIPEHPLHRGNEMADELATAGTEMAIPTEQQLQPAAGEETYHLLVAGTHCQGSIKEACRNRTHALRLQEMKAAPQGSKAAE